MQDAISEEDLFKCIKILVENLFAIDQQWAFTGSFGQYIQGMELGPHDIDIQTDKRGAYAINKILKNHCVEQVYFRESEKIKSYFGVFEIDYIKIEVMGDIQKLVNDFWTPPPDLESKILKVNWRGLKLPVMDLKHELQAYNDMGRFERVEKIKRFLEKNDIN